MSTKSAERELAKPHHGKCRAIVIEDDSALPAILRPARYDCFQYVITKFSVLRPPMYSPMTLTTVRRGPIFGSPSAPGRRARHPSPSAPGPFALLPSTHPSQSSVPNPLWASQDQSGSQPSRRPHTKTPEILGRFGLGKGLRGYLVAAGSSVERWCGGQTPQGAGFSIAVGHLSDLTTMACVSGVRIVKREASVDLRKRRYRGEEQCSMQARYYETWLGGCEKKHTSPGSICAQIQISIDEMLAQGDPHAGSRRGRSVSVAVAVLVRCSRYHTLSVIATAIVASMGPVPNEASRGRMIPHAQQPPLKMPPARTETESRRPTLLQSSAPDVDPALQQRWASGANAVTIQHAPRSAKDHETTAHGTSLPTSPQANMVTPPHAVNIFNESRIPPAPESDVLRTQALATTTAIHVPTTIDM
ncbi:hypothetical protein DFP72DRAFT_1070694 [Ephemerocybe angulata]|uniref:Uncharacterized protein n=1 Tax=Ephemerocybe angulata TaxID=980116 RepID=A0A8H6HRS5_9AGAR|nr:hypothetical protein DFP72DRAFT_1070694 [Tulosesus angulatus]